MREDDLIGVLKGEGPLTGEELSRRAGGDVFRLWQLCRRSSRILSERVGRRFLRLDRAVEGFARLTPSIRREFQTYTVLGLEGQEPEIEGRARALARGFAEVSRRKRLLAAEVASAVVSSLDSGDRIREKVCFIVAGDVTYSMAHANPRPEKSTGKIVRGSDLDIVVIAADEVGGEDLAALDRAIHRRKHYLLVHPDYREEIDYVIKPFSRVGEQARFSTFEDMVAGKILREGEFLHGSQRLFLGVKEVLASAGIPEKLDRMETAAWTHRRRAEERLRDLESDPVDSEFANLFFTREERIEDTLAEPR